MKRLLLLLLAATTIAACGGGSSKATSSTATTTTTAGPGGAALQAFRDCMTQHGVTLPTRPPRPQTSSDSGGPPDTGGGGRRGNFGAIINSSDPATQAAFQACQSKIPADLLQRIQKGQTQFQAFRSCMTTHGVTLEPRTPGSTTTTTPAYAAAFAICKPLLPQGGFGGPGGNPPTTTAGQ